DIARECGYSVATISMALRDFENIPEPTKSYIKDVAVRLKYRPNYHAKHLPKLTSSHVSVVFQSIKEPFYDPFYMRFLAGVYMRAYELKLKVQVEFADEEFFEKDPELMYVSNETIGFIIFASSDKYIKKWESYSVPIVIIADESNKLPTINACEFEAAYNLAKHLIEVHKAAELTVVRGDESLTSTRKRVSGFLKAISQYNAKCIDVLDGRFSIEGGYEAAKHIKTKYVLAANDLMAAGVLLYNRQIKITGMDNSPISKHLKITTANMPLEEMGKKAVEILKSNKKSSCLFKMPQIIRKSCGCNKNNNIE
ncbi:MAG: LacI family transcriptional regulator, partial [bacterium]|nr:LacI family transcriptional regulator [bacterium]